MSLRICAICAAVGGWPENTDVVGTDTRNGWGQHQYGYFMGRFCIDRHRKAVNVAYCDGHVARVELQDLWKQKWNRQSVPNDVKVP